MVALYTEKPTAKQYIKPEDGLRVGGAETISTTKTLHPSVNWKEHPF